MSAGQAVQCETCGTIVQSKHRHDLVRCTCPTDSETWIYVDGGSDYLRMGAGRDASFVRVNP